MTSAYFQVSNEGENCGRSSRPRKPRVEIKMPYQIDEGMSAVKIMHVGRILAVGTE